jgi:hypothetical protein
MKKTVQYLSFFFILFSLSIAVFFIFHSNEEGSKIIEKKSIPLRPIILKKKVAHDSPLLIPQKTTSQKIISNKKLKKDLTIYLTTCFKHGHFRDIPNFNPSDFAKDILSVLGKVESAIDLWRNVHFKKNGQTYLLRQFEDDGENGSIKKMIYYKEFEDGTLQKIPLPPHHQTGASKQIFESYFSGDNIEVLYNETLNQMTGSDHNSEILVQLIDNQLKRLDIKLEGHDFHCKIP